MLFWNRHEPEQHMRVGRAGSGLRACECSTRPEIFDRFHDAFNIHGLTQKSNYLAKFFPRSKSALLIELQTRVG
jgi:hypothetical protein